MGCYSFAHKQRVNPNPRYHPPSQPPAEGTTPFRHYTLAKLMAATHGFARRYMISKGGDEYLPTFAYRGRLHGGQQIAVKRFSKDAWPDEEQFREEVIRAGRLRHRWLVRLIGYCCEGDERLLVAEFMPNDSLARHLFNSKTKTMEWSKRLTAACYIAEALEYCIKEHAVYYDLNPHKILFDEAGDPYLSCFGLVKNHRDARCYHTNIAYTPPGCVYGVPSLKSMIYSFGILLRDLLSGKQISEEQAMDAILGTRIPIVIDSRLWGKCSAEGPTALVELAHQCLQYKPICRPSIKDVIATLAQIQSNAAVCNLYIPHKVHNIKFFRICQKPKIGVNF